MQKIKKKAYKKIALALSLCAILAWTALGTSASLAWFSDASPEVKNIINFAEFDLEVSYRLEDEVTYVPIDSQTDIFDDEALYEPGYTQIVYLKVKNNGTVPFNYQTAVIINSFTSGTNVFGQRFNLQEHLKFGLVTAETDKNSTNSTLTEKEVEALVAKRELAKEVAAQPLNTYHSSISSLGVGETTYMALVVRMPEDTGNVANYRGTQPEVNLGISVTATQMQD